MKRNQLLDVIRGLAIAGVVATHSSGFVTRLGLEDSNLFQEIAVFGKYGVEVFFALSGYLIFSLYWDSSNLGKEKYFQKRFWRIMPLWALFLLVIYLIGQLRPESPDNTWYSAVMFAENLDTNWGTLLAVCMALTFTLWLSPVLWNNLIPGGWSIQAEVAHYLAFPALKKMGIKITFIFLIGINVINICLTKWKANLPKEVLDGLESWNRLGFSSTFAYFLMGGIAFLYFRRNQAKIGEQALFQSKATLFIFAAYFSTLFLVELPLGDNPTAITFLIFTVLLAALLSQFNFSKYWLTKLGKYAYFIYFFHFIALQVIVVLIDRLLKFFAISNPNGSVVFLILFIGGLAISLPFAFVSLKFYEGPLLRIPLTKAKRTSAI